MSKETKYYNSRLTKIFYEIVPTKKYMGSRIKKSVTIKLRPPTTVVAIN